MEIHRPRGTRDFLFDEMEERKYVENTFRRIFEIYGFREIKTPLFEELSLFTLKSGEGIIEQIYHFQDKGGRDLALRPELTAPVARLYVKEFQKMVKPLKMYYFGSCFRYERPQAGRWRQFWQFGCELIGGNLPESEAEIIVLASHCLTEIGLKDYEFHIGHLGILRGILRKADIAKDDQDQIMAIIDKGDVEELKNLMKNLEIKNHHRKILLKLIGMKGHREIIDEVYELVKDNEDSLKSLDSLNDLLDTLEAYGFHDYIINLGIARGLDYYSGTVFEIYVKGLGAQKQVSGGGTYNLIEMFGGEPVVSTGFAFGFDRVLDALKKQGKKFVIKRSAQVFVVPLTPDMKMKSFKIVQELRRNGIPTEVDLVGRKLKKTLSFIHNKGIDYVILVGSRELKEGKISLKNMESGEQELISYEDLIEVLIKKLG